MFRCGDRKARTEVCGVFRDTSVAEVSGLRHEVVVDEGRAEDHQAEGNKVHQTSVSLGCHANVLLLLLSLSHELALRCRGVYNKLKLSRLVGAEFLVLSFGRFYLGERTSGDFDFDWAG